MICQIYHIVSPEETSAFIRGFPSINVNVSDPNAGRKHSRAHLDLQLGLKPFLLSFLSRLWCTGSFLFLDLNNNPGSRPVNVA